MKLGIQPIWIETILKGRFNPLFKKPGFKKLYEKLAQYLLYGDCFEVAFRLAGRVLFGIDYSMLNIHKTTWLLFLKPVFTKPY